VKDELSEKVRYLARFARAMRKIRLRFPEHARELDRALYDVGQKLESCLDPNCNCRQSFEEFHAATNRVVEEELRESAL
jgi:hypothetical protein